MTPPLFTRPMFRVEARPLPVKVGEHDLVANPVEMSTGSLGYRGCSRTKMFVAGCLVDVQLTVTVTVVNSKKLPPETI